MIKTVQNYSLIDKIGSGTYGQVFRATNSKKHGQFAVKVIPLDKYHALPELQQCTANQIKALTLIGPCEHIIRYQQHFQTKNNLYLAYQYCNGGTLQDMIKHEGSLPQKTALNIFRQLLQAFKVINRFKIIHRDIKPQNIFMHKGGRVKLGDFGFCKGSEEAQGMPKNLVGSPLYMAPQVLRGDAYTSKADVWSLGVVLFEMLFGQLPFMSTKIEGLLIEVTTKELTLPLEKKAVSEKTQKLLRKLLTKDYFRRISWIELFGYKIDEKGNYIQEDARMFMSSNYIRLQQEQSRERQDIRASQNYKFRQQLKDSKFKQESLKSKQEVRGIQVSSYTPKQQKHKRNESGRIQFYSQKYVDLMSRSTGPKGLDRRINSFDQSSKNATQRKNGEEQKIQEADRISRYLTNSKRNNMMAGSKEDSMKMEPKSATQIMQPPVQFRQEESIKKIGDNEDRFKSFQPIEITPSIRHKQQIKLQTKVESPILLILQPKTQTKQQIKTQSNKQIKTQSKQQIKTQVKQIKVQTKQQWQPSKRSLLVESHHCCLLQLQSTLAQLQSRGMEYLQEHYLTLQRIQKQMKHITQQISISETHLLDIASSLNYEIILVDRQMLETKQQMMQMKTDSPARSLGVVRPFSLAGPQ